MYREDVDLVPATDALAPGPFQRPIRAVVLDLDGTLLDSFSSHFRAYQATFAHYGIAVTRELFLACYSPHYLEVYSALGLPQQVWDEANGLWLEEAARQEPAMFPGVKPALEALAAQLPLALVTSGTRRRVVGDLNRTGIAGLFQIVVAAEDVLEPKPAPEGLYRALRHLGIKPEDALYVGDSQADLEMSQAAGVRFVGVNSEFSNWGNSSDSFPVIPIVELPALVSRL